MLGSCSHPTVAYSDGTDPHSALSSSSRSSHLLDWQVHPSVYPLTACDEKLIEKGSHHSQRMGSAVGCSTQHRG